ncbi:hypothetical protein MCUN1_000406 [Malassezia cuniculi]|uniref:Ribosomal RNA-processing protein 14 n=1 Tax=Malassezia cuniculi TaxID=948313 RepID=A0AAF0EVW0_9BASI|nr:hypothetical protein MCUN1_000406 [Malassezia cuniculi]
MSAAEAPAGRGLYKDSLARHDAAFSKLLSMIPAKFYLPASFDEESAASTKYQKNKRTKSQKQKEAEERKELRSMAKRAKLDPSNAKSIEQVQAERKQAQQAGSGSLNAADDDSDDDDDENENSNDVDDSDDDDDIDDADASDIPADATLDLSLDAEATPPPETAAAPARPARKASISELRERLHSKIETLRRKRNPSYDDAASGKQALLAERRRQRGEMRDKRRKERTEVRKSAAAAPVRAPGLIVAEDKRAEPDTSALTFSQVSFNTVGVPEAVKKSKYALPSDPKAALAALEARKRREEAKAQRDGDDAGAREEAHRWGRAMAAAEGVKLRDNEALLKQTIKRREKSKAKSAKAWNDRRKAEEEAQAAKQKKRMENISARRDAKKGKAPKPRPGFEGAPRGLGGSRKGARPQKR